jgi:nucleoside-diphosphate-sugar epimerase
MMKNKKYLVLGATGSIGYAFTKELLNKGKDVTILVRNKAHALKLFEKTEDLYIIEGDVNDSELLKDKASNIDVLFHGINYPYHLWYEFMKPITQNIIDAAKINNALILFPGNIYAYGNIEEQISEQTIAKPSTKKGILRLELELMLQEACDNSECRCIVLRLPDFYGPNVTNGLIKPIFDNAAKGKSIKWLINAEIPHQFVFTPDAARVFYKLTEMKDLPSYFELNYSGEIIPSIKELASDLTELTGNELKVNVMQKTMLNILSLFIPVLKELKENFYQFENTIKLDDSKLRKMFPDFKETNRHDALSATIQWWQNN